MDKAMESFLSVPKKTDPHTLSPLVLAYIGDSVFDVLVRNYIIQKGNRPVNELHKLSKGFVSAEAQAKIYLRIKDCLTEEESAVFKRGRNAKSNTVSKNASLSDYRHATGLEAVFGFLFLSGEIDRLFKLFDLIIEE